MPATAVIRQDMVCQCLIDTWSLISDRSQHQHNALYNPVLQLKTVAGTVACASLKSLLLLLH